ncbi:FecR family protein [Pedobacter africanus]|uniref:FecR family protein n=1 Tax=Pedobacter africanus TaxID=151894 RepID=A0A1W2B4U9_9SPHI|nr:FecR family protein [Pedobacter africanus]SMC67820.1 FecR family protein [Pedobacter africanus]
MDRQQAKALVKKYNRGLATAEEQAVLENWYMQKLDSLFLQDDEIDFGRLGPELKARVLNHAGIAAPIAQARSLKLWPSIAAAAAIILVAGAGLFYYVKGPSNEITGLSRHNDIAPGSNKAVLTLGNGHQITLTDAQNGALATEDDAIIRKTADGQLVYRGAAVNDTTAVYNTISIPKGGQYTLSLSDGTKVVLNAASSLKYPIRFKGASRTVELTGEGYFEVAHNQAKPFKVISRGQIVEVLGTHFNVNAYADEPGIRTTLLEGSVDVNGTILKPNQQSVLSDDNIIRVRTVDVDDAVAWKDGLFKFDHTDIKTLMRQISRWYDVEVAYEPGIKDEQFYGKIERSYTLSEVLKVLELGKVHFRVEGRKIIVMP